MATVVALSIADLSGSESTGGSSLLRPLKFAPIKILFELPGSRYRSAGASVECGETPRH